MSKSIVGLLLPFILLFSCQLQQKEASTLEPFFMKLRIRLKESLLSLFLLFLSVSQGFSQRTETNFNQDWRFILEDNPTFSEENLNDSIWTTLDVPHDWSFEKGVREGGDQGQGGGYHDGGIGWYHKSFELNKERLSNTTYIEFEGVYMNSEVWVNGVYLGKRPYGYISFRYDITEHLKEGQNTIAVRVDNSLEPSARWYHPCGIYAPVHLIEVQPTHIAPNGIFITTPNITDSKATVVAKINMIKVKKGLVLKASVLSPKGKILVTTSKNIKNIEDDFQVELEVANPSFWSPETPEVYQLITQIESKGTVLDEVKTNFGFRTIEWKTETGFWLNGENIKLKGVCEHWEGGPVGGAWTKPMLRWKLQLLKDMGINAIRPSHNPTPPMFYDLCDEIGLLVMDEIFDGWHKKAAQDYGKQAFDAWWQRDVKEWITRDRNHPSIFVWSLGNETYSTIAPELVKFGKSLDATRLFTSGAGNSEDMEIIGVNGGSETKRFIESKTFDKPFISTEAPHTWQTRGYYRTQTWWRDNELPGTYPLPNLTEKEIFFYEGINPKNWKNRKQSFNSSYDNATVRVSARKYWEVVRDLPWHSGHFRWTGFDYYGEAGLAHGGLPFNLFMGGALDVAGFKKDLFYFYQSQWTKETMLHVFPSWTHPRMKKGTVIPVWVYSNADEVELFLNGKSLGKDRPGKVWNEMQCEWMVHYQEGTLEAIAYNKGKEVKRITLNTSGQPSKLKTTIHKLDAEGGFNSSYIVTSEGLDANGNLFPYAENKVYYNVLGNLEKVSIENGNPIDPTSRTKADYRSMFFGKVRLFLEEKQNAQEGSLITGAILGDKALYVSNKITIDAKQIRVFGKSRFPQLEILYTTNGDNPETNGIAYKGVFEVTDGTTVKAVVKQNGKVVLNMIEKFEKNEGLFWGDEHSEDMWIGRGINIAAEEGIMEGGAKSSKNAHRFKGSGFVKFDGKEGAITWYQENDGEAGDYSIRFRYMHNNTDQLHPMELYVNDEYIRTLEFHPTGGWEKEWKFVPTIITLNTGANNIQLKTTGKSGPFIDELYID
ncbi:glycoside hydrolase family 2 TIM barrel-domain containing protein [Flagellimonas sp. 389]|uniref:glycoside hydrolase family 2 TIM barrel-domain containing protein n=1 Tax=Flagellimonas sp. 389 TaxID=2835862 RepID=UPI002022FE4E|nr:glycoside hydrolase family 2 TIM barrel-domain containing protein [Flagellimonas sp. 389]